MFFLACRLISVTTAFLSVYSSYKAIRVNDSGAIEHWLMYWVVMACLHVVENTVEWTVKWFPFYYEFKSLVILWLTLPQIQGSTFIYLTYVDPFLTQHEKEIDSTIAGTKEKAKSAGLDYLRRAWMAVRETVMRAILAPDEPAQAAGVANVPTPGSASAAPPTLHDPVSAPAQQAWSFANSMLKSYGPAAIAAGQALIKPLSPPRGGAAAADAARRKKFDDLPAAPQSGSGSGKIRYPQEVGLAPTRHQRVSQEGQRRVASASAALVGATGGQATASKYSSFTRQQLRQRRIELERELAALEGNSTGDESMSVANTRTPSPNSMAGDSLRPGPPSAQRDRHISAPTPPRSSTPTSPMYPNLESSAYDTIARDEVDEAEFPNDWGRNVASKGWKGAPPTQPRSNSGDGRPVAGAKRYSFLGWGQGVTSPGSASGSEASNRKDA